MLKKHGAIVLMGSGELTSTMVEVHKRLLSGHGRNPKAVFVDTPAGFQLNVDQIYKKAQEYFTKRVQQPLNLVSFKSAPTTHDTNIDEVYTTLRQADYILIGPGSPTYALQQWRQSSIPEVIIDCIKAGGCLVAASAAALTVGRSTLPVYEIYKVGQPLHWVDGLDLLGHFGFNLVVVPHWNNAEGGNHDTRYCFMGAPRLEQLEALLSESSPILGIDEHTALIIDLAQPFAVIEGVGNITLRSKGKEQLFSRGDQVPLSLLRGETLTKDPGAVQMVETKPFKPQDTEVERFWDPLHQLADKIRHALALNQDEKVAGTLLELERRIWQSQELLEERNEMGAAREIMREMISLVAAQMGSRPASLRAGIAPLVEAMIDLRAQFRKRKEWAAADAVRDCLMKADIVLEDLPDKTSWQIGA